jgi:hypothetical protein
MPDWAAHPGRGQRIQVLSVPKACRAGVYACALRWALAIAAGTPTVPGVLALFLLFSFLS